MYKELNEIMANLIASIITDIRTTRIAPFILIILLLFSWAIYFTNFEGIY